MTKFIYIYIYYIYLYTDILFEFFAVFPDIYHEIVRTDFLPSTANDCFWLCQETCVYAKITALICLKLDSEHVQNNFSQSIVCSNHFSEIWKYNRIG